LKFLGLARAAMTSNWVLSIFAIAALLLGIGLSFQQHNFQWLSRFGALVICVGIIALARPSISGRQLRLDVKMTSGFSQLDPEHYLAIGEPLPDWFAEEKRAQTAVGWLGPLLCLVGTTANGFADLLTKLFWPI
jgi:hypothetical protein